MIRRTLLAAACIALSGGLCAVWSPTRAEPPAADAATSGTLGQALGRLPRVVTQNPAAVQAVFLDLSALPKAAWQDGQLSPEAFRRLMLAATMPPFKPLSMLGSASAWEQASGIPFAALDTMTAVEDVVAIWRPRDPARIPALETHIRGLGFTATQGGSLTAAEDTPFTLRMQNPWLAMKPGPTSVGRDGDVLIQAASPAGLRAFTAVPAAESALADPALRVALSGLNAQLGQGRLVQAAIFTPAMTLRTGDPAQFMDMTPGQASDVVRRQAESAGQGLPPYARGIMADVEGAAAPALLISLAYPDCGTAEAALARFATAWEASPLNAATPSDITRKAVQTEQGCAAVITIQQEQPGLRNVPLQSFQDAYMRRNPTPLDIY